MKEIFKEKYLKYIPEITLEIFTLVWNRLIELGYKHYCNFSIDIAYNEFKGDYEYFKTTKDHPNEFNCYSNGFTYTETTVEEILGYDPFVKETTTAKDWNKVTEEELLEEAKSRYPIGCKVKLIKRNTGGDFKNEVRFTTYKTFDYSKGKQLFIDGNLLLFHEGIWAEIESLPEIKTKEVIPEYIECIKPPDTSSFKPSTKEAFDAQVEKEPVRLSFYVKYCDEFTEDLLKSLMEWSQKNNTLKNRGRDNSFEGLQKDGYFLFDNFGLCSPKDKSYIDKHNYGYGVDNNHQNCFTEYSIKDVKELINYKEPKSIEKWSVGSYVVCIERYTEKFKVGDIGKIEGSDYKWIDISNSVGHPCLPDKLRCKWFATKPAAEEFAKTLIQPVKEEVKLPFRQAVRCETQEEWDFVLSKLPISCLLSKQSNKFVEYNTDYKHENGIAVDVEDCAYCGIGWYKNKGYQILSFQEWCDLNGYKMEKEVKFEVGKWYKLSDGKCKAINKDIWYVKSPILIDGQIQVTEHWHKILKNGGNFGEKDDYIFTEVSIEEIQQYLPEGHPDKIKVDGQITAGEPLNNYNMNKKKYNIKELETNSKLLIYIDSEEERDKIRKVSKRICPYYGKYCYSLYNKSYSGSSSRSCHGSYDKDSIILTIYDIIFEDNIENGDKEISDESYIGKYVSFNYLGYFYDKAFIIRENGYIYLLNNCYKNNDGHSDKSIYKYSLKFESIKVMLKYCKDIKFLDFESIKVKPLCPDDLTWELVENPNKIEFNYLPEPK